MAVVVILFPVFHLHPILAESFSAGLAQTYAASGASKTKNPPPHRQWVAENLSFQSEPHHRAARKQRQRKQQVQIHRHGLQHWKPAPPGQSLFRPGPATNPAEAWRRTIPAAQTSTRQDSRRARHTSEFRGFSIPSGDPPSLRDGRDECPVISLRRQDASDDACITGAVASAVPSRRQTITGQTRKGRQSAVAIFHAEHKMIRFTPDTANS
jgi:hypothetical protein